MINFTPGAASSPYPNPGMFRQRETVDGRWKEGGLLQKQEPTDTTGAEHVRPDNACFYRHFAAAPAIDFESGLQAFAVVRDAKTSIAGLHQLTVDATWGRIAEQDLHAPGRRRSRSLAALWCGCWHELPRDGDG